MYEDRIALYIRLSSADEDTGRKKDESNSIVNQRSLIHSFLDKSEELSDIPRREFVDDGYSGTNTNRPAFQEMIRLIRDGQFNICISKDFSRMCRDYLEMGDYLECLEILDCLERGEKGEAKRLTGEGGIGVERGRGAW